MSKRSVNQVLGAIGEAEAVAALLRTGAAINNLTGDDSGWDLHLHLPAVPMEIQLERLPATTWDLSGRTVHVQVKKVTSKTLPALRLDTVQGWLSGTAAGTPTMLLIVPGKGLEDQAIDNASFATPATLRQWIPKPSEWPDSRRRRISKNALYQLTDSFGYVLDAWSRYPNVAMGLPGFDEALASETEPDDDQLLNWIGEIAAGYFNHIGVRVGSEGAWWRRGGGEAIANSVLSVPARSTSWQNDMLSRAEQAVEAQAYSRGYGWHEGLPVATYTLETDAAGVLRDFEAMAHRMFSCLTW